VGKKKQQTYNVIFILDKRPNLNPKPNLFFYYVLTLNNFDYGRFEVNNKVLYPWFGG
jgi:hypothetical protein